MLERAVVLPRRPAGQTCRRIVFEYDFYARIHGRIIESTHVLLYTSTFIIVRLCAGEQCMVNGVSIQKVKSCRPAGKFIMCIMCWE